jgi:hypothetical protein
VASFFGFKNRLGKKSHFNFDLWKQNAAAAPPSPAPQQQWQRPSPDTARLPGMLPE